MGNYDSSSCSFPLNICDLLWKWLMKFYKNLFFNVKTWFSKDLYSIYHVNQTLKILCCLLSANPTVSSNSFSQKKWFTEKKIINISTVYTYARAISIEPSQHFSAFNFYILRFIETGSSFQSIKRHKFGFAPYY